MRVLYLTEEAITFSGTLVRGGAIHVRNVVSGLRDRGHEVHLVDWNDAPEVSFQHSVRPRFRFVEGAVRSYDRTVGVGRDVDADIVVSKTRKTYLPGFLAARRLGIPHVVHVGSTLSPATSSTTDRLDTASVTARLRLPHDAYLVVCERIASELRQFGIDGSIFNVQNAVDATAFSRDTDVDAPNWLTQALASHEDSFRLGYVGGLHSYKGVFDLAEALERTTSDTHLFVAGDGPARESFESETGERATFLGSVPYEAIPSVYSAVNALVLPSHTEGLPRVILEAMANETPVIATRVGGVPEVIDNGQTGLLCDPHDPAGIADAVDRLAADAQLRDRLREAGREVVLESFSWAEMYDSYEDALFETVHRTDGESVIRYG